MSLWGKKKTEKQCDKNCFCKLHGGHILPNKMSACSKWYVAEEYKKYTKEYTKVIMIICSNTETSS